MILEQDYDTNNPIIIDELHSEDEEEYAKEAEDLKRDTTSFEDFFKHVAAGASEDDFDGLKVLQYFEARRRNKTAEKQDNRTESAKQAALLAMSRRTRAARDRAEYQGYLTGHANDDESTDPTEGQEGVKAKKGANTTHTPEDDEIVAELEKEKKDLGKISPRAMKRIKTKLGSKRVDNYIRKYGTASLRTFYIHMVKTEKDWKYKGKDFEPDYMKGMLY